MHVQLLVTILKHQRFQLLYHLYLLKILHLWRIKTGKNEDYLMQIVRQNIAKFIYVIIINVWKIQVAKFAKNQCAENVFQKKNIFLCQKYKEK